MHFNVPRSINLSLCSMWRCRCVINIDLPFNLITYPVTAVFVDIGSNQLPEIKPIVILPAYKGNKSNRYAEIDSDEPKKDHSSFAFHIEYTTSDFNIWFRILSLGLRLRFRIATIHAFIWIFNFDFKFWISISAFGFTISLWFLYFDFEFQRWDCESFNVTLPLTFRFPI